jgi:hypothetical protein
MGIFVATHKAFDMGFKNHCKKKRSIIELMPYIY